MSFKVWAHDADKKVFVGAHAVCDHLPSGLYNLGSGMNGEPYAYLKTQREDRLIQFENGPLNTVLSEADRFWKSKDRYDRLGVTHKRGMLFYGPPGNGKTGAISALIKDICGRDGLAIEVDDINDLPVLLPMIREIEKGRPILLLLEDIDRWGNRCENLLTMLDGAESMGQSILFISTTNYLSKVSPRIRSRPSRIDTLIRFSPPRRAQRIEYLKFVLEGLNWSVNGLDIEKLSDMAVGVSLAGLKEVLLSTVIYDVPPQEAVDRVKGMEKADIEDADSSIED